MLSVDAKFRTGVGALCLAVVSATSSLTSADIFRWDNGEVIPGTVGITPGPGVQLDRFQLNYADLSSIDLTGAKFWRSNLTYADLSYSIVTNASLDSLRVASIIPGGQGWGVY